MAVGEHIHRFSTDAYLQIVQSGSLARSHVELLDGLIVDVTAQGEHHVFAIQSLTARFSGSPWLLRVQMPLATSDGWVPEPDLAITPPQTGGLRRGHPAAGRGHPGRARRRHGADAGPLALRPLT
jgi:hypothetical protein